MNTQLVISGVPDRLRLDSWWFANDLTTGSGGMLDKARQDGRSGSSKPQSMAMLLSLFLVVISDWLFWQYEAGLSVALFALAMNVAMLLAKSGTTAPKEWALVIAFTILANLPVIDHIQPLSVLFTALGIVSVSIWLTMERFIGWYQSFIVFLKISFTGSFRIFVDLWEGADLLRTNRGLSRQMVALVLPLSFGALFLGLFIEANPVFERFADTLAEIDFLSPETITRIFFWCIVLAFSWPYLNLRLFRVDPKKAVLPDVDLSFPGMKSVVTSSSVRNSLILFNGIFAAQTGLDLLVLSGGMSLPEGMNYASYAHRGAYPLIATALLAGTFAIGTRKLIIADKLMRGLVYLWLLQNLFLVLSAAFRLNLYVETYALTYLRVAAFIWMFLVFVGLFLVSLQIYSNKSNVWLITRNSFAILIVLYASCFANFPRLIAGYNISHPVQGKMVDFEYICNLGPHALPVILSQESTVDKAFCKNFDMPAFQPNEGWRDWGFRNWRLQRYLSSEFQYQVSYEQYYPSR